MFVFTTSDVFGLIVAVIIAATLLHMYIKDLMRERDKQAQLRERYKGMK